MDATLKLFGLGGKGIDLRHMEEQHPMGRHIRRYAAG
jgi:hypothetical protein